MQKGMGDDADMKNIINLKTLPAKRKKTAFCKGY